MDTRHHPRLLAALTTVVFALATAGLSACSSQSGSAAQPSEIQTTTNTTSTTNAVRRERSQVVSYEGATVYAGSTDFSFEDAEGQPVQFRVSNLPEHQTIDLPPNMLDEAVVEGPPGPNPDLIGKDFVLVYDEDDQLIRVELDQ